MGGFISDPSHALWLVAASVGLISGLARRETRRTAATVGLAVLVYLVYIVSVGDDGLFIHRFYVPIVAPLAFLIGLLFYDDAAAPRERDSFGKWSLKAGGVFAVVIGSALSVQKFQFQILPTLEQSLTPYLEGNIKLGRYLESRRPPDTLIAVPSAGAIPFYSGLPTIDMYGLNDAHIGRGPFQSSAPGHLMKWDNAYVLSRRPELIVLNRGYVPAGQLPEAEVAPMDLDLVQRLRSNTDYELQGIRFADGSRFFVFERLRKSTR
jgi:4-amino-4-deoxy-L-arabinose transferase-like glycosyltransferase